MIWKVIFSCAFCENNSHYRQSEDEENHFELNATTEKCLGKTPELHWKYTRLELSTLHKILNAFLDNISCHILKHCARFLTNDFIFSFPLKSCKNAVMAFCIVADDTLLLVQNIFSTTSPRKPLIMDDWEFCPFISISVISDDGRIEYEWFKHSVQWRALAVICLLHDLTLMIQRFRTDRSGQLG